VVGEQRADRARRAGDEDNGLLVHTIKPVQTTIQCQLGP
jgi:hypothetical protein